MIVAPEESGVSILHENFINQTIESLQLKG